MEMAGSRPKKVGRGGECNEGEKKEHGLAKWHWEA
jgi:hypothetical protein